VQGHRKKNVPLMAESETLKLGKPDPIGNMQEQHFKADLNWKL